MVMPMPVKQDTKVPHRILNLHDSSRIFSVAVYDTHWVITFKDGAEYKITGPTLLHFGGLAGSESPGKYYEKVIKGFKAERLTKS